MNVRFLITGVIGLAALLGGLAAFRQQFQLRDLATSADRLQTTLRSTTKPTAPPAVRSATALSEAEKLELMRLRAEVTRLRQRQRELANVRQENEVLRSTFATGGTNGSGARFTALPGWVRRQEAQFLGNATPEAALQSFFWAIEHRDTNVLMQILSEDQAEHIRRAIAEEPDKFWARIAIVPGYRLIASEPRSDTEVVLKVETLPTEPPDEMRVSKVGNEWRLSP
ncbi:MAG: hypothetical protein ACYDC1_19605 [Limisphaerales bacterium]